MFSNRFAFGALAVACVAAAAAGGYLAERQTPAPAAQQSAPATTQVATTAEPAAAAAPVASTAEPAVASQPRPTAPASDDREKTSTSRAVPTRSPRPDVTARPQSGVIANGSSRPTGGPAPLQASTPALIAAQTPLPAPDPAPLPARVEAAEPSRAPEPTEPARLFDELVVPADSVVGLQLERSVSSEHARVEDRVEARVTRDVRVGGKTAIPAGARAIGSVSVVERGGKFKERARLGVRFHTLLMPDGSRVAISTDTVYREGEAPGNEASKKIGGAAVGGAILGAILGGAKGAAIGATAGAGAGGAVVAAGDRNAAVLSAGTPMTVRLLSPVTVSVEDKE